MRIRAKLMLAFAVAVAVLAANIGIVSVTIRMMQHAVAAVTTAVEAREANYAAIELAQGMRGEVTAAGDAENPDGALATARVQHGSLTEQLGVIRSRVGALPIGDEPREAVAAAVESFEKEWADLEAAVGKRDADLALEHSLYVDDALATLYERLSVLNVALRDAVESGMARERAIHNLPMQAGIAVGLVAGGFLLVFAWVFTGRFTKRINAIRARLMDIAEGEGDLTARITNVTGNDEIRETAEAFNNFAERLRDTIAQVRGMAEEVRSGVRSIATANEEMSSSLTEQADQGGKIARAMDEFASSVQDVATKASEVAVHAEKAGTVAHDGGKMVGEVRDGMRAVTSVVSEGADRVNELSRLSDQIGQVIVLINEIADQTNLLALNAAIEAARAGEHGRGFAVVADEVRQLASRTTKATEEVSASIRQIQSGAKLAVEQMSRGADQVCEATELTDRAEQGLTSIVSTVGQVVTMIGQIAAAAEEQGATGVEVKRRVTEIAQMIMQADENSSSASAEVSRLMTRADSLDSLLSRFRLD